ncbi:hypothetical protein C900_02645 [Fulvivirga imtechensis AK7]|uniref:DUF4252 domain-containing protein n=1 Tax=Fulvivirga imtechensis AK7 TaxID=1237149 RepID=L8JXQ0_9BACT|nr:DUF4252 domain-containing protein [Fulvivirga imtechensis]ELR73560.1 hypothetical protein C900_02645 [Fulvivirga imtechensis AK7]
MKKLITLLLLVSATSLVFGQSKTIEAFHSKYKEDRDAKVISLNGSLFKLMASIASFDESDEDLKTIGRIADGITSMEILAIPMYKTGFDHKSLDDMRSQLKGEKYEELMTVKEGSDRIYFMTQGTNSQIKNMLVLIKEDDEFMVMNINGSLDMKDLAYLAKQRKNWN